MPLAAPDGGPPRKRERAPEEPTADIKRSRRTATRIPFDFDKLSKLPLCRRVLLEFDRRTLQTASQQRLPRLQQPPVPELPSSPSTYASVKRFARLGGPSLNDLISYPDPSTDMSPRRGSHPVASGPAKPSTLSKSATRTGRSSAYDPAFEQQLQDYGIFTRRHKDAVAPNNIKDIKNVLGQRRRSLSPSRFNEDDFDKFCEKVEDLGSEDDVMSSTFQTLIGKSDIPSRLNIPFRNLAPLTDGSLTTPQPDFFNGIPPGKIRKSVRDELSDHIVPSTISSNPILPNFFVEAKGPDGSSRVCRLQACYDGAFGARAMHALRAYVDPHTAYDGNAYTISGIYMAGNGSCVISLYATHPVAKTGPLLRRSQYHMTLLGSYAVQSSLEDFQRGASALRNARDWARDQRELLVSAANSKASGISSSSKSSTDVQDVNSSPDELGTDHPLHRVSSTPPMSQSRELSAIQSQRTKRKRQSDHD